MLLITFKCANGTTPSYLPNFKFTHSVQDYSTRCQISNTIVIPEFKTNARLHMSHVSASHLWNNLPSNIRMNFNVIFINNQFKNSAFIFFIFYFILLYFIYLFFGFLILDGCSFKCYHLFSHEAQGRNVPNSFTVGMGFHCLYVPNVT